MQKFESFCEGATSSPKADFLRSRSLRRSRTSLAGVLPNLPEARALCLLSKLLYGELLEAQGMLGGASVLCGRRCVPAQRDVLGC